MLKSSLCDYIDAYVLVKETRERDKISREVSLRNSEPVTDYISKINNIQVDNGNDLDVVMLLYNVIESRDNYLKTSESLCQYYLDELSLNNEGKDDNFPANSVLFRFKQKVMG